MGETPYERHRLSLHKRFCRSRDQETVGLQQLFDEAEQIVTESGETNSAELAETETVTVKEHARKTRGRIPIDPSHPHIEYHHHIPAEDKQCACGSSLVQIGEETR